MAIYRTRWVAVLFPDALNRLRLSVAAYMVLTVTPTCHSEEIPLEERRMPVSTSALFANLHG
jgi:hypothetical protein